MNTTKITLGSKVRDTITGYTGIAVAITYWLNGCIRIVVQAQELKDGKPVDSQSFDDNQMETLASEKESPVPAPSRGGPMPDASMPRDPRP